MSHKKDILGSPVLKKDKLGSPVLKKSSTKITAKPRVSALDSSNPKQPEKKNSGGPNKIQYYKELKNGYNNVQKKIKTNTI